VAAHAGSRNNHGEHGALTRAAGLFCVKGRRLAALGPLAPGVACGGFARRWLKRRRPARRGLLRPHLWLS